MPSAAILEAFIARVESNAHVEAIRDFYTEGASMRENFEQPRVGQDVLMAHEAKAMERVMSVRSKCVRPVFADGDHVVIRWIFEFEFKDGSNGRIEELAYQRWAGEKIAEEQFFYDPKQFAPRRPPQPIDVRQASEADAPAIAACVCAAYLHYIERIGRQPFPMTEDYAEVIRDWDVHVATQGSKVIGAIVLKRLDEGFYIDNVSVLPAVKGQKVGKRLLDFAESAAMRRGYDSIFLATHEKMVENRAIYEHLGYVQYDHRVVNGFPRVFLRKQLG